MTRNRAIRLAITAVVVVVTLVVLAIRNVRGQTAEFVVPTGEAALIFLIDTPNLPGLITVTDTAGGLIWRTDAIAPGIRQMRLRPGNHRLVLNGREDTINFAGGTWTLLTIAGSTGRAGYDIRRRQINLAGNQYAGSSLSDFLGRHRLASQGYRPVSLVGHGPGLRITLSAGLE